MRQKAQKRRNIDLKQTNTLHFYQKNCVFCSKKTKFQSKKQQFYTLKNQKKEAISKSL